MLTLYVDTERWRGHLRSRAEAEPGLVPVAKGNGYGFGNRRLAEVAHELGADTLAVGTYAEVADVERFPGSVMVLSPWRPFETRAHYDNRLVHTISRLEDLTGLAEAGTTEGGRPRVVLERLTSMRRHGFSARGLREAAAQAEQHGGVVVEGFALHLPLGHGSHLAEVERLMTDLVATGLPARRVFVSHLTDSELEAVQSSYAEYEIRRRVGTSLWLGDRGALRARATVLDVHPVERGDVYGYRARSAPGQGHLLVVSGGTAHGIGLEAPTGAATIRDRAARIARGGLDAVGFVRSPFTVAGKQRLFAEPPHMQASMLFLPSGAAVPDVGDEVDVQVRFTATAFDQTVFS